MKKLNLPFIIGLIILLTIVVFMAFPNKLSIANPYTMEGIRKVQEGGKSVVISPPFKPSKESLLGTDEFGRDMYSLMVYGTRLTVTLSLLTVLGRFLIALPIGLSAGLGSLISRAVINQFSVVFSGVPALLIAIIVLKMNLFTSMFKSQSIISFIVVLTIVGWSRLGLIIMERVQDILSKPFVKGEIAIGKSKFKIAVENVIPHLAPEIIVLFFMEIALALTIIMQLGIFGVYVGNVRIIIDSAGGSSALAKTSFEPEWASMLSTGRSFITVATWIPLVPAIAFITSIFGFNMFGEGIRIALQKRDSKFTYYFRRGLLFWNNDFLIGYGRMLFKNVKSKITLAISIVFVIGIIFAANVYKGSGSPNTFSEINLNLKDEVIIGTEEAREASVEFEKIFKDIGLEPIDNNGFVREYQTDDIYFCTSSKVTLKIDNQTKSLVRGKDYSVGSFDSVNLSGRVYDATEEDIYSINDLNKFDDKFVLLDGNLYSKKSIEYFINKTMKQSKAKGFLVTIPDGEELPNPIGSNKFIGPVLWLNHDIVKSLLSKGTIVSLNLEGKKLNSVGRNIIGMLPGEHPNIGGEALIIGIGYNYMNKDKDIGKKRLEMVFDMIKKLSQQKRDRTIILALWDGIISDDYNGVMYYSKLPIYDIKDCVLYIDLTNINADKSDVLYYNAEQVPFTRPYAWGFKHDLEENIKSKKITTKLYDKVRSPKEALQSGINSSEAMYYGIAIPTIIASVKPSQEVGKETFILKDIEEAILKTAQNINY